MSHSGNTTQPRLTPATSTTKRGIATASFTLGLWGLLVFWWYPFGMLMASVGIICGIVTQLMGIRAGKDGENLALVGIFLGCCSLGFAIGSYRFMQMAFENQKPRFGWSDEFETALISMGCILIVVGLVSGIYAYLTRPTNVSNSNSDHV
jgi:hypothetical protein